MKRYLSIILAVVCMFNLCVVSFAKEPTKEELSDLKKYAIIQGDPDGNLRLGDTLTRAEAVKIICTMAGYDKIAENSNEIVLNEDKPFPDVPQGHWATEYIRCAKNFGIVEGDENGYFNPEAEVKNEEFVKMLVIVLGYDMMAQTRGGYPVGYNVVANTYGVTQGLQFAVNTPAIRSDVAVMSINSLDVPLMKQTGFGDQISYSVMDGENGHKKETLRINLELLKK